MFGYALNPNTHSQPSTAEPSYSNATQLHTQLKNAVARMARRFLQSTNSKAPRYKCPVTALLTRIASWDANTTGMHANSRKKRSRRLAILRFDGD